MVETLEKVFNFKRTIKDRTSILIDAFTAFYGVENRKIIEEKTNSIPISLKIKENSLEKIILESKMNELLIYVENNIKNELVKEKINKLVIKKAFSTGKLYIKEFEMYGFSSDLYEMNAHMEYEKTKKKFTHIKSRYKEIDEILKIYSYTKEELKSKYRIEYQNKVKDLLLNHTKIPVNIIANNLELFVENDFNDIPLVHLVHETDNNKIISIFENDMLFPKEMVLQGIDNLKKEYFDKMTGKDLKLEEYYNDPKSKQCILNDKILSNLETIRQKMIIGYNKSLIDIFDFITSKKGITKDFYIQYNYSKTSQSNWKPCKNDNELWLQLYTIIYFDDLTSLKNIDATIIHEINHLLELRINKQEKDKVEFSIGWETFIYDFKTNEMTKTNKDKYFYINEGINELISLDILKNMHSKENYIFNKKNNFVEKNSIYNRYEFLLKQFYEEYKEYIIKSRLAGDINIIIDKVGDKNFNDLNNLVNDFNKYFSGSKPLKSFEEKKNIILEKMKERGKIK